MKQIEQKQVLPDIMQNMMAIITFVVVDSLVTTMIVGYRFYVRITWDTFWRKYMRRYRWIRKQGRHIPGSIWIASQHSWQELSDLLFALIPSALLRLIVCIICISSVCASWFTRRQPEEGEELKG